ncbi:response regulator transcription factor [bacterium]|nr:response regulator transcription factor [bacterium]MCB9479468.1 response regulator transcription factor [Deltaproteobacteria bacterium]
MAGSERILIVDDDAHIREVVRFALTKAGFETTEAADGAAALARFESARPDLIVLDIAMPELDGTEVCRRIRASSATPIIFLTSRDDEIDRVVGLEMGGDDYVTKPFSPRELVARVKAVLRRAGGGPPTAQPPGNGTLRHGELTLDTERYLVHWGSTQVTLSVTEFGLLRTLMGFPGKVFSRDELIDGAYAYNNVVTDRTVDSHIRRLRRKFADAGAEPIETVHGVGYKLGPCR